MIALPRPFAAFTRWLERAFAAEQDLQARRPVPTALSLYRVGVMVRCTDGVAWRSFDLARDDRHDGPRTGDVLRVVDMRHHDGEAYLIFARWPGCAYRARHFEPLPEDV